MQLLFLFGYQEKGEETRKSVGARVRIQFSISGEHCLIQVPKVKLIKLIN